MTRELRYMYYYFFLIISLLGYLILYGLNTEFTLSAFQKYIITFFENLLLFVFNEIHFCSL